MRHLGSTGETPELVAATVLDVKLMLKCMAEEGPGLSFCSVEGGFRGNCSRCRALKKSICSLQIQPG